MPRLQSIGFHLFNPLVRFENVGDFVTAGTGMVETSIGSGGISPSSGLHPFDPRARVPPASITTRREVGITFACVVGHSQSVADLALLCTAISLRSTCTHTTTAHAAMNFRVRFDNRGVRFDCHPQNCEHAKIRNVVCNPTGCVLPGSTTWFRQVFCLRWDRVWRSRNAYGLCFRVRPQSSSGWLLQVRLYMTLL